MKACGGYNVQSDPAHRGRGMIGPDFFLFVFFGCIIGFLAGLFGVGGGGLIVPLLVFSYEHSGVSPSVLTHIAMGTSLFVILSFMA